MSVVFCTDCGHKIEYVGAKPNFCSACGFNFLGKTIAAKTTKPITTEPSVQEGETEYNYVPNLNKIDCDIDVSGPYKMHTLGQLLNESTEEEKTSARKIPKKRRRSK